MATVASSDTTKLPGADASKARIRAGQDERGWDDVGGEGRSDAPPSEDLVSRGLNVLTLAFRTPCGEPHGPVAGYTRAMKVVPVGRHASFHRRLGPWFLAALGFVAAACNRTPAARQPASASPTPTAPAASPPAAAADPAAPHVYGAPLAADKPTKLAAVLANPDAFRDRAITVAGKVRKACTRKGCWMELAGSTDDKAPGCRVTFKDYGFFVPTDSAGSRARVQGTVVVDTLAAATVRHYEEEGAVFPGKKADGTAPEVRLVASGVELWRDTRN
jgi:hypothetical protein